MNKAEKIKKARWHIKRVINKYGFYADLENAINLLNEVEPKYKKK